jgi:hypothetical protein
MPVIAEKVWQESHHATDMLERMRAGALPESNFGHLQRMTSSIGLWEHALYSTPRVEHGFCTDDNARALILLDREPTLSPELTEIHRIYLQFLQDAALNGGGFHNRRRADGDWADTQGSDDSQGRAIWALGSVARFGSESWTRGVGVELFKRQVFASSSPRANAFAVLGAAEVLGAEPTDSLAREALENWAVHLRILDDPHWPWPEPRLAYDNPRIPEALMAAGDALGIDQMVQDGIRLLDWLIAKETRDGHFSFAPVGGWAAGEERPGFDQQPVEAAAFADACNRAWQITGDNEWRAHVLRAARWFMGDNDGACLMYNPETGGCYDGLSPTGPNLNQGAESTIAALSTLQQAAKFL